MKTDLQVPERHHLFGRSYFALSMGRIKGGGANTIEEVLQRREKNLEHVDEIQKKLKKLCVKRRVRREE